MPSTPRIDAIETIQAVNKIVSADITFSTASNVMQAVASVNLTTKGRPVDVFLQPIPGQEGILVSVNSGGGSGNQFGIQVLRNGTPIYATNLYIQVDGNNEQFGLAPGIINFTDFNAPVGLNTYALQVRAASGSTTVSVNACQMVAIER
jgi:hypothetical protein